MAKIREISRGDLRDYQIGQNPSEKVYPVTVDKAVYTETPTLKTVENGLYVKTDTNQYATLKSALGKKLGDLQVYYINDSNEHVDTYYIMGAMFPTHDIEEAFRTNFLPGLDNDVVDTHPTPAVPLPLSEAFTAVSPTADYLHFVTITSDLSNNSGKIALSAKAGNSLQEQINSIASSIFELKTAQGAELIETEDKLILRLAAPQDRVYLDYSIAGDTIQIPKSSTKYLKIVGHNVSEPVTLRLSSDTPFRLTVYKGNPNVAGEVLFGNVENCELDPSVFDSSIITVAIFKDEEIAYGSVGTLIIESDEIETKMYNLRGASTIVVEAPTVTKGTAATKLTYESPVRAEAQFIEASIDGGKTWSKVKSNILNLRPDRPYTVLSRIRDINGITSPITITEITNG